MSTIKSFSVGNGDMFYIDHNSDNFTTIDCCYKDEESRDINFNEIKEKSSRKGIRRFISTHPDEDHIKGLPNFCETIGIENFYVVENKAIKLDEETENFKKYCNLRDDRAKAFYVYKECTRQWMNLSSKERGCSGINFLWPDLENKDFKDTLLKVKQETEFNNISPIFTYILENGVKVMWLGDIETDFLEKIENNVSWIEVDILFAPHHGRNSGKIPQSILDKLKPTVIVIGEAPSENLNYYQGYNTITQNSAGDITFDCLENKVHVYVSNEKYKVYFLDNEYEEKLDLGSYIGTFSTKQ